MYKKYIICFLILSILNFTGCTYLEVISKEDVDKGQAEINFRDELFLTTKDSTKYHFLPANFYIANDTLYGKGTIEDSSSIIPFHGSVALTDVESFEQWTPDTWATIGLITGILAIGLVVVSLVFVVTLEEELDPD